jgi:hypothetical protein
MAISPFFTKKHKISPSKMKGGTTHFIGGTLKKQKKQSAGV